MCLLSIIAGADLGFVIAHHHARIVFVILGVSVTARCLISADGSESEGNSS
ncbi:hypothetical protein FB593_11632 [Rhizobium sp. SJZ105]|nr:hypothetical protein FB593_11632 [Rhizobium sp. SJZ105]